MIIPRVTMKTRKLTRTKEGETEGRTYLTSDGDCTMQVAGASGGPGNGYSEAEA